MLRKFSINKSSKGNKVKIITLRLKNNIKIKNPFNISSVLSFITKIPCFNEKNWQRKQKNGYIGCKRRRLKKHIKFVLYHMCAFNKNENYSRCAASTTACNMIMKYPYCIKLGVLCKFFMSLVSYYFLKLDFFLILWMTTL